jgi:FKBP-type peptidyl-prolyl cis-trans isomerase
METTLNGVLNGDNSTRKTYPSASSELSASYSEASNETDKTTSTDVQSTATNTRHDNINDDTSIESSEDWIDVLGNSCLLKKIIKNGEGVSTRPSQRSQVAMRVRSFLPDGTVVDRHSSLLFTVGDHDVIQGLTLITTCVAII